MNRIRQIEEISMNAWPALKTLYYDGWIIRFAEGVTKRSNSVNPIYSSTFDIISKIEYCEKLYHSMKIPVCFKLTEASLPLNINNILEDRGYKVAFDISVQVLNICNFYMICDDNAYIAMDTDDKWLDHYCRMNEVSISDKPVIKKIIDHIVLPKCLLIYTLHGSVIGCGLGVVEDKFIGLFDIVIDRQYRNQGFGEKLIENILKWGKDMGAEFAYLQVLSDNISALKLYEKTGFREEYRYWYMMKK